MSQEYKPIHAVTMGDPAGSGPEIVTKTLADPEVSGMCRSVVIGDAATMEEALKITGMPGRVRAIKDVSEAEFGDGVIEVLDLKNVDLSKLTRGEVNTMAGAASFDYIKLGTELTLAGKTDAIVTSAINKESINKAGYHYDGHTSMLAEFCGTPDVAMMLVAEGLRVSHVTTHVSMRQALDLIRPERILKVLELTRSAVQDMGVENPYMVVAGLNPHSGEDGLFGDEEIKYILPTIEEARRRGFNLIDRAVPPDTAFFRAYDGQFDAAIAMYHDQGHIAVKMLGIWLGVNVTLGLPIIRTSVDHGTNFGKAGKGTADPRSMNAAMKLATVMARSRKAAK
jgi:4-hydroxythreonine-4-phosphate dehydrogenase